jgi:type 1 glutamine amidotransferase
LFAGWPAALRGRAAAANDSITVGLGAFDLETEQYWVLADDFIEVLATTTQPVRDWDP